MTLSFDKSTLPSRHVSLGPERAPHRSYYYAMGLSEEEIARPFVALASAGNNSAPCNTTLDAQADAAQAGVNAAGGMPRRFNTITVTDGIAMGHQGMKSSLVSREVIADSVELSVRGHCYDALVGFAGCDKSLPGMMMAMLRLNVPSIFVYGGSILPGRYREKDVTVVDVFEAVGQYAAGNCPIADLHELEKVACPGHGACGGQFTANTMACVGEAIGLSLPNSNMVPAPYSTREQIAIAAGAQVMELIHLNLRPRDICTREAFINAARVVAATGGSTNGALHLPAMAHEAGIDFDLFDVAEAFKSTPYIADLKPGGKYVAKDMYEAGGVYMLMKTMLSGGFLDGNCLTVTGKTLGENIDQVTWNPDQKVIYDINTPITPTGGVVGLDREGRRHAPPGVRRSGPRVRLRGGHVRCGRGARDQRRRSDRHPLRGPQGRPRHARDALHHCGAVRAGLG
jgi:dihydroxy-acid dehydratase